MQTVQIYKIFEVLVLQLNYIFIKKIQFFNRPLIYFILFLNAENIFKIIDIP